MASAAAPHRLTTTILRLKRTFNSLRNTNSEGGSGVGEARENDLLFVTANRSDTDGQHAWHSRAHRGALPFSLTGRALNS